MRKPLQPVSEELPHWRIDNLATEVMSLSTRLAAIEAAIAELQMRTAGMIRFGPSPPPPINYPPIEIPDVLTDDVMAAIDAAERDLG